MNRLHRAPGSGWLVFVLVVALCSACGSDPAPDGARRILRVGSDYERIQDAVDNALPGDLILIEPGTYREAVTVGTPELVLRGTDRNAVVLDGGGELINGIEVVADQVAIENLTVRNYAVNGVIFTQSSSAGYGTGEAQGGPIGWRASYVTASNNGLYGLYAFGTGAGQFDHNYASGSPDSGIYVGQCQPCDAVVVANVAERNAIGYENTNASGVIVAGNTFRSNRIGVTLNSSDRELLAPQVGSDLIANRITDNDEVDTPESQGGFGVGVAVAGGTQNRISRNTISGHSGAGVVITDQEGYLPADNTIADNDLTDNALDLLFSSSDGSAPDPAGNCFATDATTTAPEDLEELLACGAPAAPVPATDVALPAAPEGIGAADVALPPPQVSMPGDVETWAVPARRPRPPDLETVRVPSR